LKLWFANQTGHDDICFIMLNLVQLHYALLYSIRL